MWADSAIIRQQIEQTPSGMASRLAPRRSGVDYNVRRRLTLMDSANYLRQAPSCERHPTKTIQRYIARQLKLNSKVRCLEGLSVLPDAPSVMIYICPAAGRRQPATFDPEQAIRNACGEGSVVSLATSKDANVQVRPFRGRAPREAFRSGCRLHTLCPIHVERV